MKPSVILFDLDGTLADSMSQIIETIATSMAKYGVPRGTIQTRLPALLALPANEMFAAVLLLGGIDLVAMAPAESAAFMEGFLGDADEIGAEPFPEVIEVLERLQVQGIVMFLTTNAPQSSLAKRLADAGLDRFFRWAFGTGRGIFKGPAHVEMAAEELGISVEELAGRSVLVGDSAADMRIAVEAGIVAIGRLTGDNGERLIDAGASYVISDLRELEALLEQL